MSTTTYEIPGLDRLVEDLAGIEEKAMTWTLADAIREGAGYTKKKEGGWIEGESACALGAAWISAKARRQI